jgi:hypothetical protein
MCMWYLFCMYACAYDCMYVFMCVYMYACMYSAYICREREMYACIYILSICTYVHVCVHVCIYIYKILVLTPPFTLAVFWLPYCLASAGLPTVVTNPSSGMPPPADGEGAGAAGGAMGPPAGGGMDCGGCDWNPAPGGWLNLLRLDR